MDRSHGIQRKAKLFLATEIVATVSAIAAFIGVVITGSGVVFLLLLIPASLVSLLRYGPWKSRVPGQQLHGRKGWDTAIETLGYSKDRWLSVRVALQIATILAGLIMFVKFAWAE